MSRSYVVTGGGRGIGRAMVERLLGHQECSVAAIELDPAALAWMETHPAGIRAIAVVGDAADEAVAERAATSSAAESESPHTSEATEDRASPTINTRRLPQRSAALPAGNKKPPKAST